MQTQLVPNCIACAYIYGSEWAIDIILSFLMTQLIASESRDPVGLRHSILAEVSMHPWITVESL